MNNGESGEAGGLVPYYALALPRGMSYLVKGQAMLGQVYPGLEFYLYLVSFLLMGDQSTSVDSQTRSLQARHQLPKLSDEIGSPGWC